MPGIDDRLQRDLERAARPAAPDAGKLLEDIARRRARRSTVRRVQAGAVAFAVVAAAFGTFAVLQTRTSTEPTPGHSVSSTQSVTAPALRLGFPTCDVSSMPIVVDGEHGFAYVAQKASDAGCPKHGDFVVVAVDVNGDGRADTSYGPLADCYLSCEAFAAPDLNGDGNTEIAVSTAGADGYGVYVFVVTRGANPSIEPVRVSDPHGIGTIATDPLQLAWVDVVTHFSGAHCAALTDGATALIVDAGDKLGANTAVTSTTLVLRGATATVVDATHATTPLSDAPLPGNTFCGTPLHGSAANFPDAAHAGGATDVGLGLWLCDVSTLSADLNGDGAADLVWVGTREQGGKCSSSVDAGVAAVDLDGDHRADGWTALPRCIMCRAYGATDLDADGALELVILLQASSTPEYAIYESSHAGSERGPGLSPLHLHPGDAKNGFPDGVQLTFFAGGDEGYSYAVDCQGYPRDPVLVLWRSEHPVDGPGSNVSDIYETKLKLGAGGIGVIDARHFTQATSDPVPFDGTGTACGVDWDPFA